MKPSETLNDIESQATHLANKILKVCYDSEVSEDVAQAALANSWGRICLVMGIDPEEFNDIFTMVLEEYKQAWEKENGD